MKSETLLKGRFRLAVDSVETHLGTDEVAVLVIESEQQHERALIASTVGLLDCILEGADLSVVCSVTRWVDAPVPVIAVEVRRTEPGSAGSEWQAPRSTFVLPGIGANLPDRPGYDDFMRAYLRLGWAREWPEPHEGLEGEPEAQG